VIFETLLFTAQSDDNLAENGVNPSGTNVFNLYATWDDLHDQTSTVGAA
jgi:hypothetical protein